MPTYEYRCKNGHDSERFFRKITDAPGEIECPECGLPAPRQMSAGAGLLFKGSGFYLTDYGKNAHRSDASAKKTDSVSKSEKPSTPETKPASAEKPASDKKSDSSSSAPAPKKES